MIGEDRGRALVAAPVLAAVVLLVVLGAAVQRAHGPLAVDRTVLDALLHHPGPTALARGLTEAGGPAVVLVVLVMSMIAWWRLRDPRLLLALPLLLLGQVLRLGLSRVVGRPRPPLADRLSTASGLAWPSGHTTSATLGWGIVVLLAALVAHHRRPVLVALSGAAVAGVLVGATRVLLRVHWLTDVVAGLVLGEVLLVASVLLLTAGGAARTRSRAASPPPA